MDNKNLKMLQELDNEIKRLGLQDSPSRTKYTKEKSEDAPAATTVIYNTKLNWRDIVLLLGYNYSEGARATDRRFIEDGFLDLPYQEKIENLTKTIEKNGLTRRQWADIINIVGDDKESKEKEKVPFIRMSDEAQMSELLNYLRENNIRKAPQYIEERDKERVPSMSYIVKNMGGWKNIKDEYEKRFGEKL